MKTIKISEAIGPQLDYLVAKANGATEHYLADFVRGEHRAYSHSTLWEYGGQIIEHIKGFEFKHWLESKPETCCEAHIHNYEGDWIQFGPTPLVAAMRCYVAWKLGETVEVPEMLA